MGAKILIVDDSSIARGVIKKALRLSSIAIDHIYEAGDGLDALGVVDAHEVDLILLDINMPRMGGMEFMRELRKTEHDIPVFVVSTEGSDARRQELQELGIAGYLRKPVTPERLLHDIVTSLPGGASW